MDGDGDGGRVAKNAVLSSLPSSLEQALHALDLQDAGQGGADAEALHAAGLMKGEGREREGRERVAFSPPNARARTAAPPLAMSHLKEDLDPLQRRDAGLSDGAGCAAREKFFHDDGGAAERFLQVRRPGRRREDATRCGGRVVRGHSCSNSAAPDGEGRAAAGKRE